ncbi:MAG TPA: Fic family protein [Acidothermaceae bacterium]|nr:Fic family protein [Acidothermaceae bacterium]
MRPDDFAAGQRRYVVRAERGYKAFVPPPLPPALELDPDLVGRLSAADRALGSLAGVGRTLPNARLLLSAALRREAVLSSRIEGTQASLSELVLFEMSPTSASVSSTADVREVLNYVTAVEHVLDPDRRLPLSLSLLREAHGILFGGIGGGYATPGDFRTTQNWIGTAGCTLGDATYVPPPPELLWECLDSLEKYLHTARRLPPLVAIACAHYQFEAIHPFVDGNGRIGRLLIILLMVEWGLLPAPLLDLSAYIEPRRDEYYRRLLAVTTHGDWTGWLSYFLRAVEVQSEEAAARALKLQELREDFRLRMAAARSSGLLGTLTDALFETPAISIPRAAMLLGVTHRSARLNIDKLVQAGILTEIGDRARNKLFLAREVLAVVEGTSRSR